MNTRKSQFTNSKQIHKPVSKAETEKLAQSCSSISYGEISRETNNSIKQTQLTCPLTNSNKATPDNEVSVEFAAKQLFQIILVDIKGRNARLNGELVPVPFAGI